MDGHPGMCYNSQSSSGHALSCMHGGLSCGFCSGCKTLVDAGAGGAKASDALFDVLVVGAGPTGLACAIEAQKAGFTVILVDKGCVCNSLFHYPSHMTFFTTPELLEIGDIPFPSPNPKPTRNEALQYYRQVAAYYKLDVRQYHRVERVEGADGSSWCARWIGLGGRHVESAQAGHLDGILRPAELMCIPGENLSKVHHYYNDPHPTSGRMWW